MNESPDLDTIFCRAIEIESAVERQAWLNRACGENAELRQQVERLVAAHFRGGSIIDAPALEIDATLTEARQEPPGTQIGPYKLLQVIGEGGMGVVYMAEQSVPVKRRVALKLIKPGMDSQQVIARFEAERQALSMMDHVNIARVLDASTTGEGGRPYFVMELIQGVPITKYCDDNHLTPRQRLELFVPVCQAIQHAHQKGIIHRDIKPSNVMVTLYDGRAVPKVIDFGIAKATEQKLTERTLFTQYGTMVGTLEYMSPEQAEMSALGVDTRSDIYSLGVLLYELLTGTTPLSHKRMKEVAFAEILRLIKEEEPPKPSTRLSDSGEALASISALRHTDPARLPQLMRGELDWIVMKTLEKDRNRRYETANGFAADLQRYLNDEHVLACPPSTSYRLKKFIRRYRPQVLAASFIGLALIGGVIGTTWGMFRAIDAQADADIQRQRAEVKSAEASRNLREARKAVDDWFTKISQTTLLDAPGLQPLRQELLEAALTYYRGLLEQSQDNPELRADLAAAHMRLSVIYVSCDRNDDAIEAMLRGLEIVEQLMRERPDDADFAQRLAGYFRVGRDFYQRTRPPTDPVKAFNTLQNAAVLWEQFARDNPANSDFRGDLAGVYALLSALTQTSDMEQSLAYSMKAGDLLEPLVRDKPDSTAYHELLVLVHNENVDELGRLGRGQEGERAAAESRQYFEDLAREFPGEAAVMRSQVKVLIKQASLRRAAQPAEAEQTYQQALRILETLTNVSQANAHDRLELRVIYNDLAGLLRKSGRNEESELFAAKALAINEKLVIDFPDSPQFRLELAKRYSANADQIRDVQPLEAERSYQQALAIHEKLVADFPNQDRYAEGLESIQNNLINLMQDAGHFDDLEQLYRRMIATAQLPKARSSGANPNYAKRAEFHNRLGIMFRNTGKLLEAEVELRAAQELWRRHGTTEVEQAKKLAELEPEDHNRWHSLFYAYYKVGDWENCLWAIRKKQDVISGSSEWEWFYEAMAHWQLEQKDEALGKYHRAIDRMARNDYRYAKLRLYQAKASMLLGRPDPGPRVDKAMDYFRNGIAFEKEGKKVQAKEAFSYSADLYESLAGDFPGVLAYTEKLVDLLARCDRKQELEKVYRQAIDNIELTPGTSPNSRLQHSIQYHGLAMILVAAGRHEEAEEFIRNAIQLRLALANENPNDSMYRFHLAHSYFGLALVLSEPSREVERVKSITEAGRLFRQFAADESANADFRQWNAHALWSVGDNWLGLNRFDEAQQAYEQSLATFQQLEVANPAHPFYRQEQGFSLRRLAVAAERAGRMDDAEKHLRKAVVIYLKLTDELPDSEFYRVESAVVQKALGSLLLKTGELFEDETAEADLLRLQPELAGVVAGQCLILARKRLEAGDSVAAQPLFERAIMRYRDLLASSPSNQEIRNQLAAALAYQGVLLEKMKSLDQAATSYREAILLWNELNGQNPNNEWYQQEQAYFSLLLSSVLQRTGDSEDAVEHTRNCVRLNEQLVADFADKPHHRDRLAQGRGRLIGLFAWLGRTTEVKAEVESLLKGSPSSSALNGAAWPIVSRPGTPAEMARLSLDLAKKAVELSPEAGHIWNTLGVAHYRTGEWNDCIAALRKSSELRKGGDAADWFFLAMAHWQLDQKEEARTWLSKAIEWADAHAKNNAEMQGFRVEAETLIDTARVP